MAKEMAACFLFGLILTAIFLMIFFNPPELPHVILVSLNVSQLNFTSSYHTSGYVDMHFQVLNANLLTDFSYDDVYCSVYHGERRLASTMFPAFFQRARETKPINFTVYLTSVTTAREGHKDPYSLEEFDVELVTFVKWRLGSFKSVTVSCDEVPVGLVLTTPGHGKMIGPARKCKIVKDYGENESHDHPTTIHLFLVILLDIAVHTFFFVLVNGIIQAMNQNQTGDTALFFNSPIFCRLVGQKASPLALIRNSNCMFGWLEGRVTEK